MDQPPAADYSAPVHPDQPATRRRADPWRILTALGIVGCLPTIGAVGARLWWLLELCVHFRAYYAGAFLLATVVFLLGRKWKRAALWAVFFVWNAAAIAPLYFAPSQANADGAGAISIKLLTANVHTENRDYQQFLDLIRKERPDVVIAIEIDENWMRALESLKAEYRHFKIRPSSDNFGIALYSRLPTISLEAKTFGSANVPSIVARLAHAQGDVTIIATHPLPPTNSEYAALRNEQLARVAEYVRGLDTPVIVAGDLNTTSWSPYFQDLLDGTRLRDSRLGFGIQPTWTGGRRVVRIPLDHVLVSSQIDVVNRRVGDDIGSDHFPVIAELRIR